MKRIFEEINDLQMCDSDDAECKSCITAIVEQILEEYRMRAAALTGVYAAISAFYDSGYSGKGKILDIIDKSSDALFDMAKSIEMLMDMIKEKGD